VLRLRSALREFFPAALDAFDDLTAPDALELLPACTFAGQERNPVNSGRCLPTGPPQGDRTSCPDGEGWEGDGR